MSKVKVLVVEVKNAGIGKFRFSDPHITLQKNHKDDFIVDIMDNPPIEDKDFISFYDIIVLQGTIIMNDNLFKILEKLKAQGLKIVLDVDDYWRLSPYHPMYKKMEVDYKKLIERFKIADLKKLKSRIRILKPKSHRVQYLLKYCLIHPYSKVDG